VGKLYRKVCKPETLWRAWSVVLENGRTSRSARTRADIAEFAAEAPRHLQSIAWKLQRGKYQFEPAHGVAIPKKNKADKRPVVMAPIPNRIVQRAILDVVQLIPTIKEKLKRGRNFGGIEGVGVPKAVKEAYLAARKAGYFIRTDIKSFFDNIPAPLQSAS
jgi:RNA-directed DNA polymerase